MPLLARLQPNSCWEGTCVPGLTYISLTLINVSKETRERWRFLDKSEIRNFSNGQSVMVRDYRGNLPWIYATIQSKLGPLSYKVETEEGSVWRRHVDQMIRTSVQCREQSTPVVDYPLAMSPSTTNVENRSTSVEVQESLPKPSPTKYVTPRKSCGTVPSDPGPAMIPPHVPRYPKRERYAPNKLDLWIGEIISLVSIDCT